MHGIDRRTVLKLSVLSVGFGLGGCVTDLSGSPGSQIYGKLSDGPFVVDAVDTSRVDPVYFRQAVSYATTESAGTIVVDPDACFLYRIEGGGRAVRYCVGVGKEGFGWSGRAVVGQKQKWPDWYPTPEIMQREPELKQYLQKLPGGLGVPGGPINPLGARAMYLWQGHKDTLYRIHGTNDPTSVGHQVSSGCIRMINQDAIDLYVRSPVGTRVVVLPGRRTT